MPPWWELSWSTDPWNLVLTCARLVLYCTELPGYVLFAITLRTHLALPKCELEDDREDESVLVFYRRGGYHVAKPTEFLLLPI